MKPSPKRRTGKARQPKPKQYPGRYARVWLSPEVVTWAKREKLKPAALAACAAHTEALQNGQRRVTIISTRPNSEDLYEL